MANKHPIGTELRYWHEEKGRRAQVSEVHPETGEVTGLAIYDDHGNITHGVTDMKPATTPQLQITHGYFHKQ